MNRLSYVPICVLLFVIFTAVVAAETMYIRTVVKISLRTGPGKEHKIISLITSGDSIEVLETGEEWSKIRTVKGEEGWMESVLITAEKPNQFIPITSASDNMPLDQAAILEENRILKEENMRLEAALSTQRKELEQLHISFEGLKKASDNFFKLKADFDKLTAAYKKQTEKVKVYEGQIAHNPYKQKVGWFLMGAGIILIGFIMGYNVKRGRTRLLLR